MTLRTVSLFYGDTELVVTGNYSLGEPGRMYLPNGDPGYPPEPPEFEIYEITIGGVDSMAFIECCWNKDGGYVLDDIETRCLEKMYD